MNKWRELRPLLPSPLLHLFFIRKIVSPTTALSAPLFLLGTFSSFFVNVLFVPFPLSQTIQKFLRREGKLTVRKTTARGRGFISQSAATASSVDCFVPFSSREILHSPARVFFVAAEGRKGERRHSRVLF